MGPEKLSGTIQNDILKEFMVRNTYIYPPEALDADHFGYLRVYIEEDAALQLDLDQRLPHAGGRRDGLISSWPTRWPTGWSISAPRCRRPGCGRFAPRLSFFFAIGMNFFMEAAKLRAARLLCGKAVHDRVRSQNDKSQDACAPIARPLAVA